MKEVFSYNIDTEKTAYINWRMERHNPIQNMLTIADGFMESSLMLAKEVLKDNKGKRADIIIYPILFNANHAIELYLKATVWTMNTLLNNNNKIERKDHDIQQILNILKSRIDEFESTKERKKTFKGLIHNLEEYINELYSKIVREDDEKKKANMDFSRYPFDTKYINHFYLDTFDNVTVDLENFIIRFTEIKDSLSQISNHYLYDFLLAERE